MHYLWKLTHLTQITPNNKRVFSTFACGGGSTMGYKLAGYEVIGANDIDPKMAEVYKLNYNPKLFYQCPIKELLTAELPTEMYNLDILDGSPPCSTFSTSGQRDKNWGKLKKFREGQQEQILDELFFDFVSLVDRLKPKIYVAENVQGMLVGDARKYCIEINRQFQNVGYTCQMFTLNAASMGVPQSRQRVFFVGHRVELKYQKLKLEFHEKPITLRNVEDGLSHLSSPAMGRELSDRMFQFWRKTKPGDCFSSVHLKGHLFNHKKASPDLPLPTITASSGSRPTHYQLPRYLSDEILAACSTFPVDYNYGDIDPQYLLGMSVPPIMMAKISQQIYIQWLQQ
jgi:DNA (cytosine-5)-methyltransferase 1